LEKRKSDRPESYSNPKARSDPANEGFTTPGFRSVGDRLGRADENETQVWNRKKRKRRKGPGEMGMSDQNAAQETVEQSQQGVGQGSERKRGCPSAMEPAGNWSFKKPKRCRVPSSHEACRRRCIECMSTIGGRLPNVVLERTSRMDQTESKLRGRKDECRN